MVTRTVNPIRRGKRLNRLARAYLEFKHRYDVAWECLEGTAILAVFTLAIAGRETVSHGIELASHVFVGLLLTLKMASAICAYVSPRSKAADSSGAGKIIFNGKKINVKTWAHQLNICALLPENVHPIFIQPGEEQLLHAFSKLCHLEVDDRSVKFTLDQRKKLYRKWLSSGLPCLMLLTDEDDNALVASIVLPLTTSAFRDFWEHGLDALDIDSSHLLSADSKPEHQYLLVDMLASNRDYLKTLSVQRRAELTGIGFRTLTRHLAEFSPSDGEFAPVLLCSTLGPKLRRVLYSFGFESKRGQSEFVPIYRADLGRLDCYSDDSSWLARSILSNVQNYTSRAVQINVAGPNAT